MKRLSTTELKRLDSDLATKIQALKDERGQVRALLAEQISPFKVNDAFKRGKGASNQGKEYVVTNLSLHNSGNDVVTLEVQEIKPDESLGKHTSFWYYGSGLHAEAFIPIGRFENGKLVRTIEKRKREKPTFPIRIADNAEIVEQLVRPRIENGTDYGNVRQILLKVGTEELTWERGSMYFAGRGEQAYAPTSLVYRNHEGKHSVVGNEWHEGGRLSKALLKKFDDKTRNVFGIDFNLSDVYVPGGTVVVYA
jgi:hypothetical protein